jgi:iron-regulated transporter 1
MTKLDLRSEPFGRLEPFFPQRKFMFLLVLSFAFTTWNVRSEEWATAMFLTYLYPASLLPVSLYSLCATATGLVFGPSIGLLVDKVPRLSMALTALLIQKLCIVGITIVIWSCVDFKLDLVEIDEKLDWKFGLIVALGGLLRLSNMVTTIAMERDWPKNIVEDSAKLSVLNSNLKRVDLISKLGAPLFVSLVFSFTTVPITILAMGGISTITTIVEWVCLIKVYKANPGLRRRHIPTQDTISNELTDEETIPETIEKTNIFSDLKNAVYNLEFRTCVCIAMLYLNVLSFGPVMVSYLLQRGVHATVIAVVRGLGVVVGIVATITYPYFTTKIGIPRTGLWAIQFELLFLGLACASFLMTQSVWSIVLFLVGVNISRFGLWTFDLAQTQLIQESTDEEIGTLTGIQMSMQSMFDLLAYGSTVIWSSPDQFWLPSVISLGAVFFAAILYVTYMKKKRGHLIHWEKLPLLGHHSHA